MVACACRSLRRHKLSILLAASLDLVLKQSSLSSVGFDFAVAIPSIVPAWCIKFDSSDTVRGTGDSKCKRIKFLELSDRELGLTLVSHRKVPMLILELMAFPLVTAGDAA